MCFQRTNSVSKKQKQKVLLSSCQAQCNNLARNNAPKTFLSRYLLSPCSLTTLQPLRRLVFFQEICVVTCLKSNVNEWNQTICVLQNLSPCPALSFRLPALSLGSSLTRQPPLPPLSPRPQSYRAPTQTRPRPRPPPPRGRGTGGMPTHLLALPKRCLQGCPGHGPVLPGSRSPPRRSCPPRTSPHTCDPCTRGFELRSSGAVSPGPRDPQESWLREPLPLRGVDGRGRVRKWF